MSLFHGHWGFTCKDLKADDDFNSWNHLETSSVNAVYVVVNAGYWPRPPLGLSAGEHGLSMWRGLPHSMGASV